MSKETEYEIFGPEWEKEVRKMPKELIIAMWADAGKSKGELLEALKEIEIIAEGGLYTPRECMNRIHELAKLTIDKAKGL